MAEIERQKLESQQLRSELEAANARVKEAQTNANQMEKAAQIRIQQELQKAVEASAQAVKLAEKLAKH